MYTNIGNYKEVVCFKAIQNCGLKSFFLLISMNVLGVFLIVVIILFLYYRK